MILIEQSHEILKFDDPKLIEIAGRTCYKSEDKITEDSADKFIKGLVKRQHGAMLEHASATVRFITNRGVTHELVRHRVASFAQESTRYVNYKDGIEFIRPVWFSNLLGDIQLLDLHKILKKQKIKELSSQEVIFLKSLSSCEIDYSNLIQQGWKPEQAREVLPNTVKTEIVITANFRGWLHIFELRALGTTGKPHPQMQALMLPLLKDFAEKAPSVFGVLLERR